VQKKREGGSLYGKEKRKKDQDREGYILLKDFLLARGKPSEKGQRSRRHEKGISLPGRRKFLGFLTEEKIGLSAEEGGTSEDQKKKRGTGYIASKFLPFRTARPGEE